MTARTGTSIKIWVNADLDTLTDTEYTVDAAVTDDTWDHTIRKIGNIWYAFSAPDNGIMQYIDMYTSSTLGGPWTKEQITNPGTDMWDYWPDFYVENNSGYLFYASKKDGFGHIIAKII